MPSPPDVELILINLNAPAKASGTFVDPYVPPSGTFTVTGKILVSGTMETSGLLLDSATNPAGTLAYVNYDGTNLNLNAPTAKGWNFTVAGSSKFQINTAGAITPGAGLTGAVSVPWVGRTTLAITPAAYSAGIAQEFTTTMTGVAFGDCLTCGYSVDVSATTSAIIALVTSAGNIAIYLTPNSTTQTGTPGAGTVTVTAVRSA
jgi:hypothetical protein